MLRDSLAVRKSCLLFIFTPQSHSRAFLIPHTLWKNFHRLHLCYLPCLFFLSSSNQPVDLRASKTNIPSLLFLQANNSVLFWEEEMAFSWCFAEHAPLETPWLCLIEEISLRLPDLGLNFPESPFALMEVTQRLLQHCYIFILEQHWKPKLSITHLCYCCIVFSVRLEWDYLYSCIK